MVSAGSPREQENSGIPRGTQGLSAHMCRHAPAPSRAPPQTRAGVVCANRRDLAGEADWRHLPATGRKSTIVNDRHLPVITTCDT